MGSGGNNGGVYNGQSYWDTAVACISVTLVGAGIFGTWWCFFKSEKTNNAAPKSSATRGIKRPSTPTTSKKQSSGPSYILLFIGLPVGVLSVIALIYYFYFKPEEEMVEEKKIRV